MSDCVKRRKVRSGPGVGTGLSLVSLAVAAAAAAARRLVHGGRVVVGDSRLQGLHLEVMVTLKTAPPTKQGVTIGTSLDTL